LAIAAQSLSAVAALMPLVRSVLLVSGGTVRASAWELELDGAQRALVAAADECLGKVAQVVGEVVDTACASLERMVDAGTWGAHAETCRGWPQRATATGVRPEGVDDPLLPPLSRPIAQMIGGIDRLRRVLAPVLRGPAAAEAGARVAVLLSSQLPVHLSAIDTGLDGGGPNALTAQGRKWMAVEVLALVRTLQHLPGCDDPTHAGFAAVASLQRWVLRNFGPQGAEALTLWTQHTQKTT
jgi:hypothetical protein